MDEEVIFTDFNGIPLKVGDRVIFAEKRNSPINLVRAKVLRFTKKMVVVSPENVSNRYLGVINKMSTQLVKL